MIYLIFIGIIVASFFITAVVIILMIKGLSIITRKLFPDIGNNTTYSGKNTNIEICCINCFDKTYNFFYSNILTRISRVIKYTVRQQPICEKSNNGYSKRNTKNVDTNFECFLPKHHNGDIINGASTKSKQNPF